MNFENCFPLWNDLNTTQKKIISDNLITQYVKKGTIIHNGNLDCTGLLLVKSGQLRTYILSDEGREITLYRLFDMDMCLLSASCIIRSIQFEVTIEAEKDTDLWIIPAEIYKGIMKESAHRRRFHLKPRSFPGWPLRVCHGESSGRENVLRSRFRGCGCRYRGMAYVRDPS